MKLQPACLAGLFVALAWTSLAAAEREPREWVPPELPKGVRTVLDLPYVEGGHARNRLDLFLPEKAAGRRPLIVWVHGGAWCGRNKEYWAPVWLVPKGYVLASINYRLSQHAVFPSQIEDCKAAIRWLRAHAAEYHFDPDHIGVWGASAGGHLVSLLGTTAGVKAWEGRGDNRAQSSRVQCVVDWCGPTDLVTLAAPGAALRGAVEQLLGGPIDKKRALAVQASPLTYAGKDSAPFLIVQGDKDEVVPLDQSRMFAAALKKAGAEVKFVVIKGCGHGGPGMYDPEHYKLVEEFFAKHLKKK